MGQACAPCSEGPAQEDRIKELEALLASEEGDYNKLKQNYKKIVHETEQLVKHSKKSSSKLKSQIKALESEKQQAFKEMMKLKKKITKLDENKSDLERKKKNMQKKIDEYNKDIAKYERESSTSKGYSEYESKSRSVSASPQPPFNSDVDADVEDIQTWLNTRTGDKKQDHKFFNKKMTELLTKRPKLHQMQIAQKWQSTHKKSLLDAIEDKLSGKTRGVPYRVLSGLLQSEAEIDVRWIQECIYNDMQISKVANVMVARTVEEVKELQNFWKKDNGASLYSMLDKLAKHYNKNTMNHLFKNLCNTEQRERNKHLQSKTKVNTIEIAKNIEWMMLTNKWKHAEKEKMCKLFTINSDAFIEALSKQYKSKSKNGEPIAAYIEKKYGVKSMAGSHLKDHIAFVEDRNVYFSNKLLILAESKQKFKENHLEILNLFLCQFHRNLNQIQITFNKNNDQSLRHFIKDRGSNHNSVYFLMKILENSKRFN